MNGYCQLLMNRSGEKCHFFSTFLYKVLVDKKRSHCGEEEYSYSSAKNYTNSRSRTKLNTTVDIFSKEMVFFPINVENIVTLKGEHWVLCVVYMKKKQIVFFDSLGQSGSPYMVNIMQYLRDEMQSTKKVKLNDKDWKFLNP